MDPGEAEARAGECPHLAAAVDRERDRIAASERYVDLMRAQWRKLLRAADNDSPALCSSRSIPNRAVPSRSRKSSRHRGPPSGLDDRPTLVDAALAS